MNNELSYSERIERLQKTNEVISEFEAKYPFLKYFTQLQRWNKMLEHYLFYKNTKVREAFLRNYEHAIKVYSNLCLCSKPISESTVKNCEVFVVSEYGCGIFKGWTRTVLESDNDYVIVEFDDISRVVHKNDVFEIYQAS